MKTIISSEESALTNLSSHDQNYPTFFTKKVADAKSSGIVGIEPDEYGKQANLIFPVVIVKSK
jgi:hypothetical protein